jgi:hypothetical protein
MLSLDVAEILPLHCRATHLGSPPMIDEDMMTRHLMILGGALVSAAAVAVAAQSPDLQKLARLRNPAALKEQAPATFKANFATSAGSFVIEVHRPVLQPGQEWLLRRHPLLPGHSEVHGAVRHSRQPDDRQSVGRGAHPG